MQALQARESSALPMGRLKRLFQITNGGTPTADDNNWGGEVVWVTPADLALVDGGQVSDSARHLTEEGLTTGSTLVPADSIILSTRAPIGYTAITTTDTSFNQGCKALTPRLGVNSRFYQYVLSAARPTLEVLGNGTTFMELSSNSLGTLRVPAPTESDQCRIVQALEVEVGRIDALAEELRGLESRLKIRMTSEVDQMVENGVEAHRIRQSDSPWIAGIPDGWDYRPLKYCVDLVTVGIVINPSQYYEDQGVPVLRGFNVRPSKVTDHDLAHMSESSNNLNSKSILHSGDVVVVRTGNAGAAAVVPEWAVGGNIVDLLLVRPGSRIRPKYLELVLNSRMVREQVIVGSVGALQSHFNTTALANVDILLPTVEEQDQLQEVMLGRILTYEALIEELGNACRLLAEHRRALVIAAVMGELDPTDIA